MATTLKPEDIKRVKALGFLNHKGTDNFNGRVNQILYLFRATDTAKKSIVIRLQCVKDCNNNNYNGVIDIKSVTLRREWIKNFDTKPAIYSTSRLLKKCQEE